MDSDTPEASKLFPIFTKRYSPQPNLLLQQNILLNDDAQKTPKRRRLMAKKETPGLTQMTLDAGQKHIGPRHCDECGILYSPGEPEDEELHRQAHVKLKNLHSVTIWKDPRILQSYTDGGIIVMVQRTDSKTVLNRLRDFLIWLESELGTGSENSGELGSSQRIFLYVCPTKRKSVVKILGCAVLEVLDQSKVVVVPLSDSPMDRPSSLAQIGLTRLWTDANFRKRHIATRLCDVIRFNSGILAHVVPKNAIAILEPSEDGRSFMNKYSEGKGFYYSYK